MTKLISLATWTQRYLLYLVIPGIILMRILAWSKIHCNNLYLLYEDITRCSLEQDVLQLPLLGKWLYFLVETVPTLLILGILWYFWELLTLYKQNMLFSTKVSRLFKKINICVLTLAVYQLFFATIGSIIISLCMPAGQRYIMIKFDFNNIMYFLAALILFMILYVVQEAHSIKSEQDLVV